MTSQPAVGGRPGTGPAGGGLRPVAGPPGDVGPRPQPPQRRYTGPPAYPTPPRWGLPGVIWRRPVSLSTPRPAGVERMRTLAGAAVPLLWLSATVTLLTAVAEGWRYSILLGSRFDAVAARPLRASDALVATGGYVSLIAGGLAALVAVQWLVRAYAVAAQTAGVRPARPSWQLVAGVAVPGLNLLLPGAVLAEIEHAALRRDPRGRPRPSRLVVCWWVLWAAGLLLAAATALWTLADTVQARADGVLLHAATDLLATAVAVASAVVVRRITALLSPAASTRRMVVVKAPGQLTS